MVFSVDFLLEALVVQRLVSSHFFIISCLLEAAESLDWLLVVDVDVLDFWLGNSVIQSILGNLLLEDFHLLLPFLYADNNVVDEHILVLLS